MCVLINIVYLSRPLGRPEYVKTQLFKILQEFIEEYNLTVFAHKGWVYFEIRRGCYILIQSRIMAKNQIRMRLEKEGYYEARTIPGI